MPDQIFLAVGKQIPRLLWNPRLYYPCLKHPLLSPVLSQKNPEHQIIFYFFKTSIIVPFMSASPILSSHCRYSEKKLHRTLRFSGQRPCFLLKRFWFQLPIRDRLPRQKFSRRQNSVKSSGPDSRFNFLFIFSPVKFDDRSLESLAATEFNKIFSRR